MLERDDLIAGLRELAAGLAGNGEHVGIRIVGGAALSLYYFDRRSTVDIDAAIHPSEAALEVASHIARRRGWPADWLNSGAAGFIPFVGADWHVILDNDDISVSVASAETLLVMKLRASRPGRDDDDIARLLSICGIHSVEAADELFESFYRGEVLEEKAYRIFRTIFDRGLPSIPEAPTPPSLNP